MRRWISLAVIPATISAVMMMPPAQGAESEPGDRLVVGELRASPVSSEEREDLQVLTEETGMGMGEAIEEITGQEDFIHAVTRASEVQRSTFFSSGWTPDRLDSEGYAAWIAFTAPVDAETVESFSALPVPVQLRFDAPMSAPEVEAAQVSLVEEIERRANVDGVMAQSEEDGSLTVSIGLPASERSSDMVRTRGLVGEVVREEARSLPVDVRVRNRDSLGVEPEIIRGGARVTACTSAFTAYHGKQKALLGADHCPKNAGTPTGGTSPLRYIAGHTGRRGDVRAHATRDAITNRIQLDRTATKTRTISSRARTSSGNSVCSYGHTTGRHKCTIVDATNVTFRWQEKKTKKWYTISGAVRTKGDITQPGDSGGPWFFGRTALGIHFGKVGGTSTFSNIMDAEAQLSVRVKIR